VRARAAIDPAVIRAQFEALHDAQVDAFHVGALLSAESVHAVTGALADFPGVPIVVDPVLAASGGDAWATMRRGSRCAMHCSRGATLVTPNLAEAGAFLGRAIDDVAAMRVAANELVAYGAQAVLIKAVI